MSIVNDFNEIELHCHTDWNYSWSVAREVYEKFPDGYTVLTAFAFSYLEELIRSTTSEYGLSFDEKGMLREYKVGYNLLKFAIDENRNNPKLVVLLETIKSYYPKNFDISGYKDNRNSIMHGYTHANFWNKKSFVRLIKDIALLSKYAKQ